MSMKATITERGEVPLPEGWRTALGLEPGDEVDLFIEDGELTVKKPPEPDPVRAARGVLKDRVGLTTDEVIEQLRGPL